MARGPNPTLSKLNLAVLAAVAQHGPIRQAELNAIDVLESRRPAGGFSNCLDALNRQCLVRSESVTDGKRNVFHWSVTDKGRRLLAARSATIKDCTIAAPREALSEGSYDGRDLRPFTGRAGAMRAYELPSLDANGERVQRVRPASLAGAKAERP